MLGRDGLKIPGKPDADGRLSAEPGAVIVHGPYWYLQRGRYEISIFGDIQGEVRASFTHEFGYEIAADILTNEKKSFQIAFAEDVRFFEVVLRQVGAGAGVVLDHIEVRDIS